MLELFIEEDFEPLFEKLRSNHFDILGVICTVLKQNQDIIHRAHFNKSFVEFANKLDIISDGLSENLVLEMYKTKIISESNIFEKLINKTDDKCPISKELIKEMCLSKDISENKITNNF